MVQASRVSWSPFGSSICHVPEIAATVAADVFVTGRTRDVGDSNGSELLDERGISTV